MKLLTTTEMIKEIKYNGFTTTPSDYKCPDGDLEGSPGLVPEDGALKPANQGTKLFKLQAGCGIGLIHDVRPRKNFILIGGDKISYLNYENGKPTAATDIHCGAGSWGNITGVNAIGNVLLVLTDKGMHYVLWKPSEGYVYLGTHLPELRMQFGLQYTIEKSDEFKVEYGGHSLMYDHSKYGNAFCNPYDDDGTVGDMSNNNYITQRVLGQANKFISEKATGKGRFVYPFLVRYAYRLYDGSYTMPSAPILMYCADGCTPLPVVTDTSYNGNGSAHGFYESWKLRIAAPVFDLLYQAQYADKTELEKWKDIVASVDVFASRPIYTYDQNGKIENNAPSSASEFSFIGCQSGSSSYAVHGSEEVVAAVEPTKKWKNGDNESDVVGDSCLTPLPPRSADAIKTDIENASHFYLLKSFKIDELSTSMTKLDVKDDYLQSLTERTELPDDYDSHDTLIPTRSHAYNSRLNLTGITKVPFKGFEACSMATYTTSGASYSISAIYVYIKQDGQDIVVKADGKYGSCGDIYYFYYPNANAYQAVVVTTSGARLLYQLSNHPFLNGAYWFGGFKLPSTTSQSPVATTTPIIALPSKVYTSEVNNPFKFPTLNIYTVGTGSIMAISTAAKALSQGQFGQFPLYAFSTDGVWALEVNASKGTYSARQPITRDVCINPDSITQLDSSVLFATARGIMQLSGSTSACISEKLNDQDGDVAEKIASLPYIQKLAELAGIKVKDDNGNDIDNPLSLIPFLDYIKNCSMAYDYVNQRVVVFNPSKKYAYVFSLKDKAWGMMVSNLSEAVNAYPDAYAVTVDGYLVNLSTTEGKETETTDVKTGEVSNGMIITRPLKLDYPNALKTVDTIIQRGYFKHGHVRQILYGSRDLFNWQLVWSSDDEYLRGFSGTPYKYFKIAIITALDKGESLYGCTVQYRPRLTNRPR